jgi:hypothetical protein
MLKLNIDIVFDLGICINTLDTQFMDTYYHP